MRIMGRILLTITAVATLLLPYLADWNSNHNFGPGWSPHARLHASAGTFEATFWSLVALWLIWRVSGPGRNIGLLTAMCVPIFHWGGFFPALLVPDVATLTPEEVNATPYPLGVPINIWLFAILVLLAIAGYWLERVGQVALPEDNNQASRTSSSS